MKTVTRFRGRRQRGDVIEGTYTTHITRSEDPDRGARKVRQVMG